MLGGGGGGGGRWGRDAFAVVTFSRLRAALSRESCHR